MEITKKFTIRQIFCNEITKMPDGDFIFQNCKGRLLFNEKPDKINKVDFNLRIDKSVIDMIVYKEYKDF